MNRLSEVSGTLVDNNNILFWTTGGARFDLSDVNYFEFSKEGIHFCLKKHKHLINVFRQSVTEAFADRGQNIIGFLENSSRVDPYDARNKEGVLIFVVKENMATPGWAHRYMPCDHVIRFKDGQRSPKLCKISCHVKSRAEGIRLFVHRITVRPLRSLKRRRPFPRNCL